MIKYSFEPIYNEYTEIFILGTLPGEKSLEAKRYYAHPKNAFWRILAEIYHPDFLHSNYEVQKQMLLNYKLGLWDIVESAKRKGSLDTKLMDIEINRVYDLLLRLPNLKKVFFNGQNAYKLYRKHFPFIENIDYQILPSTSPANARLNFEQKLTLWKQSLKNKTFNR